MSNLNPQQFQQLTMFEPVQKIIDELPKMDSYLDGQAPRDQWEMMDPQYKGKSLREHKLTDRVGSHMSPDEHRATIRQGDMKPIPISHNREDEPFLGDGHHRLAHLEAMGHTEAPVEYKFRKR